MLVTMENEAKNMNLQFCEENSEWLDKNVEDLDQCIKELLSLVEQDGDVSMEKPELISHMKEISHRHHLLADHYRKLTGELDGYMQSVIDTQNEKGNSHSLLRLDQKLRIQKIDVQVTNSDISLSSGGGISDSNEDSGSSSLLSDSDSESCNSSLNQSLGALSSGKMQKHEIANVEIQQMSEERMVELSEQKNEGCEILLGRISECEEELKVSNQKLVFAEQEIAQLKSQLEKNKLDIVKMGGLESQLVSAENKIQLLEADMEMENRKSLSLQGQIVDLESKLVSEKTRASELQEFVEKYAANLSDSELKMQKLSIELQDASGNFALEKCQLESCISELSERLAFHEATTEELQTERESLANQLENLKIEMEKEKKSLEISWEEEVKGLKAEIYEKNALLANLNQNLDCLKLKYDLLVAEKDGINSKLQTLHAELSACNDRIQLLEHNLCELHSENKKLCEESESGKELAAHMKSRIEELEEELGQKRIVISERDEEKREAIRQLCFSIDYFRGAYEELRDAHMSKRPMTVL